MKAHILGIVTLTFAVACLAIPQNKRQAYDEPRLSNEVIPGAVDVGDETSKEATTSTAELEDSSDIQVHTTKPPALDDAPTPRPGNKKKKPNSGAVPASDTFSRVIDDIFNIPISVLRAVNTLLSNAFGTKQAAATPATTSSETSV